MTQAGWWWWQKQFCLLLTFFVIVFAVLAAAAAADGNATDVSKGKEEEDTRLHTLAIYVNDEEIHDPEDIAREHGFQYGGRIGTLPGYHIVHRPWKYRRKSHGLEKSTHKVEWFQEQIPRPRFTRSPLEPKDPLFPEQWHLHSQSTHYHNTGTGGATPLPNLNVMDAWNHGVDGSGVTIAVVDDGVEWRHPDLRENYVAATSVDICGGGADPSPAARQYHGTAVAGTAAAAMNEWCGVGVAPGAKVAGIRLLGSWPTDAKEAAALSHACTTAGIHAKINHIFTNSWGPADDGKRMEGPGRVTRAAMQHCIARGRNGLGSIYVWAGGNGRANGDDGNYDGYANSRWTIDVTSVTERGIHAPYSETCSCTLCSAPSSGWQGQDRGITTTDLAGFDGASAGDCTHHFGGTSASAPMVAGVVALMLQANPFLTWRDVQHVLVLSCNITDPFLPIEQDGWITNGAGLKHSNSYGFGIPDASEAVRIAKDWVGVGKEDLLDSGWMVPQDQDAVIPPGNRITVLSWEAPKDRKTDTLFLEHIEMVLSLTAPQGRGYIGLTLCSPSGSCSFLARQHTSDLNREIRRWTYTSVRHWMENPTGTWHLKIENYAPRDRHNRLPAVVHGWQLRMFGHHR